MPDQNVVIVGAGPTGLTMAIELKRLGIPFRIVDKAPRAAQHSQALVVQARTLEQFERYGIADIAVSQGRCLKRASLISEGKTVASFLFDQVPGHYPFVLFLPQNDTERLLIEHLKTLGGTIERGTELLEVEDRKDQVDIHLRSSDGKVESISTRWLVGCDGSHSTVRQKSHIPFTGDSVGLNFFLGDLELQGPDLLGDELRVYLHRGDIVFIGRLKENLFRVIVALHSEQASEKQDKDLTLADFQDPIDRAGIRLKAISASWMTPFRVSDRRAEHMQHNHIFLAGDASHIHSPVAGQGMNTGIQDAANLAWKIAAVERGASPRLLQSYEEERGPVSKALLANTSRVLKSATATNWLVEKLRDAILQTATRLPYVQEQMAGFVSETAIAYHDSPIVMNAGGGGPLRGGDRMPNPEFTLDGRTQRLLDRLNSGRHLLIGLNVANPEELAARAPLAERLFFNSDNITHGANAITDFLGKESGAWLVRPDGYLGFHGSDLQLDELSEYARLVGLEGTGTVEPGLAA